MLDKKRLDQIDKQGMYKIYDQWPEIAQTAYESEIEPVSFGDIDHIIFAGMGGSGALGDIFAAILSKNDIHLNVVKGYHLPKTVDERTLVVATSVSGNTAETLSVLQESKKKECKIIGFSSGGTMEGFCIKNNIEFRFVEKIHSPRASFVRFLYTMIRALNPILPISDADIRESISEIYETRKRISSDNLSLENPALSLGKWVDGVPIIYYPWGLQAAAIRFKNSLQENSKLHAMAEDVIEACHNGIVAWEKNSNVHPILIEGEDDYVKTKERWRILRNFFAENKIEFREVKSSKGSILTKIMDLVYFLDYASIYNAVLRGIDPTPVLYIDHIKSRSAI